MPHERALPIKRTMLRFCVGEAVLARRKGDVYISNDLYDSCQGGRTMNDQPRPGPEKQLQNLTPEEARALIREAVRETFLMLGVKVDDPIEVQKDFQHLRDWRQTTESIKSKSITTVLGLMVAGAVGAFWVGFKDLFK